MGIEPTAQAWEAWVLPLYDARVGVKSYAESACGRNQSYSGSAVKACRWALPQVGQILEKYA